MVQCHALQIENTDAAEHLCLWLQRAHLEQHQCCLENVVERNFRWTPFANFVDHHASAQLVTIRCHRHNILVAQTLQRHWIHAHVQITIVITEFVVSTQLQLQAEQNERENALSLS